MISIHAPSRLHFGLLHVPTEGATGVRREVTLKLSGTSTPHPPCRATSPTRGEVEEVEFLSSTSPLVGEVGERSEPGGGCQNPLMQPRRFGGCGLMIDEPGIRLTVDFARSWEDDGSRAFDFAKRLSTKPLFIELEACPPEHVGLGVGTQLGLGIAEAIAQLNGEGDVPSEELARRVERGERSRIGIHGYREGGFWVDGGHGAPANRFELPADWRILLARPKVEERWHGDRERKAFSRSRDSDQALNLTEELSQLLEAGMLPAIASGNFPAFSEAIAEYNRKAGEPFASEQGGDFNGPAVSELIRQLKASGLAGSGQSSWGPTVFAFVPDQDQGNRRLEQLRKDRPDLEYSALTRPSTGRKLQIR